MKARKASMVLLRRRCANTPVHYKHQSRGERTWSRTLDSVNSFPIPISRKYRNTLAIWPSIIIVHRDVFGTKTPHRLALLHEKKIKGNMRSAPHPSAAAVPLSVRGLTNSLRGFRPPGFSASISASVRGELHLVRRRDQAERIKVGKKKDKEV